jgi:hypothetical protein
MGFVASDVLHGQDASVFEESHQLANWMNGSKDETVDAA